MGTETTLILAIIAIGLALFFDFTNGFHDSANLVATAISSNAVSPGPALMIAACGEFIGAFFLGTAVAQTLGKGIVDPQIVTSGPAGAWVIVAALVGAITWNLFTWYFGIPSSSSHALIGGLVGAFVAGWGTDPVHWRAVGGIIVVMLASPFVGFIITYVFTRITFNFSGWFTPKINTAFRRSQIFSLIAQSLSHGTNDAQKTMGVITFILVILGYYIPSGSHLAVPSWVILTCAVAITMGTLTGGWRIIKTLGSGLYTVRPIHAFASQTASAIIIYCTAIFGYPISTTQVISSSVMGAGAAFRPKMVRWKVAQDMGLAWLVTIPASGLIAWGFLFALKYLFGILS